ncbi:X-ray radiation resistance-associated protein 1 [Colossoma macropomum]|uniref:X-ray radiation resistance-associated protein 1 n=1 Tax=Colossoma macropomum TaxID=42526 RepID=UPI0018655C1E|nr:X-ray radiation resistance-associated protein 1 [Colossoma macropomum]
MAGMGVYKLDNDGESFPSNCFPIRSFFQSKEGTGHWLVAHRSSMEKSYRIPKKKKSAEHPGAEPSVGSESDKLELKTLKCADNTLNGQLLMAMHCVDKPSDLCSVDISEKKLQLVELQDLEEFDSVAYINASDNCLTLEAFSRFPALRELELSLNGLCTLEVNAEVFPRLEVLDLSYNSISADGILAVGLLPRLKVLHLTGNSLKMLPPNMAGPYTTPDEMAPQSSSLFGSLEVLMLDDNKLSSPGVFSSLANLKRLQHLNLEGNYISEVPYLEEMPLMQPPNASVLETEGTTEDVNRTKWLPALQVDRQELVNCANEEDKEVRPSSKDFSPPFLQLRYLNLASNEIAEEEALLAVALFPMLSELVIHSNPLTTQRSGDPPVLTCFLQNRLGINIQRKKSANVVKPHIMLPVYSKRKVRSKIPKVPKVPLITAALCVSESPCTERDNKNKSPLPSECKSSDVLLPCFSQTSTVETREDVAAASASELLEDREIQQTEEPFFVTEVNDLLETEYQEKTQETENLTHILRQDTKDCAKNLRGYEGLLDDNLDFDMPEPVGIQQSVRALEYALKNLLVYRDSKANLDHLQRPCREQPKQKRNLPPVKPYKPKREKVKEILTEMKESKTVHEVPLDKVIRGKDTYRKEYEKALILLKDMKRKYKMVHLKAMEQAAQFESISQYNGK